MLVLNEENFQNEISAGLIFVDYWSPSCRPCNMLAPVFEALASEYEGKIKFAKLNTDDGSNLCISEKINALPTLVLYKDGVEIDRVTGIRPAAFLKEFLDKH